MYSVNLFGSDPDLENDDCWTGDDFETLEAAQKFYENPFADADFAAYYMTGTAFITLTGPDVDLKRSNPGFKPAKKDDEWNREFAMQAGMMGGCDAYNAACGY